MMGLRYQRVIEKCLSIEERDGVKFLPMFENVLDDLGAVLEHMNKPPTFTRVGCMTLLIFDFRGPR